MLSNNMTLNFVSVLQKTQTVFIIHSKLQDTVTNIQDNAAQSLQPSVWFVCLFVWLLFCLGFLFGWVGLGFFICLLVLGFVLFFTQMRSTSISLSVRFPQDPQASDIFSVISLYSRILGLITAVPIRISSIHLLYPKGFQNLELLLLGQPGET